MENQSLPVRDMWIDRDEVSEWLPAAILPKEELKGLLPYARVKPEEDDCCKITSQYVKLDPLSLWIQRVSPKKDMKLLPQTPFRNIILHIMLGSDVVADLKNGKSVLLSNGCMDLFNLNTYRNEAPLMKGQDFLSFHINVEPKNVKVLVERFPELAVLNAPEIMAADGPVNNKPVAINELGMLLMCDVLSCRYVGDAARFFLQRAAVNMITMFEKRRRNQEYVLSAGVKEKITRCFDILYEFYSAQHSVKQLSAMIGMNERVLHELFKTVYGCTINQCQYWMRMTKAYRDLAEKPVSMENVAVNSGFKSARSFRISFRRYFKCDPIWLMKAQ